MGKKIFFLSLIILSVAMGYHWSKNRPKTAPKVKKPALAVNLDDLTLASDTAPVPAGSTASETTETGTASETAEPSEQATASATVETASGTAHAEVASGTDPIIAAFQQIRRNPFETSPFAAMAAEAAKVAALEAPEVQDDKTKPTSLLAAPYTGNLEVKKDLYAIVDARLYKAGQNYQDKKIKSIATGVITLEDHSGIYLIPKKGVTINLIASTGEYFMQDDFPR